MTPPATPNNPLRTSFLFVVPLVASSKFVRLNTLKALASNFRLNRSVSLKFLVTLRSVCHRPGPTNVLRPRLPRQARHGAVSVGRFGWERVPPTQPPITLPPEHQPFAQVLWLKLLKPGTLLLGRSFRPRVSR